MLNTVQEIITLVTGLCGLISAGIGAYFAIKNWIKVTKNKNAQEIWAMIMEMADAAMKEAERSCKTGADKKKMVILGLTFLLSSALIYLLFMVAWINVASLLVSISYIRISIGIIALIGAVVNIYGYFKHRKDSGCNVVSDNKRTKIFDRIKKFTHERNYFLAILGVIVWACSVNIVELACSAGLPVMFSSILSMNNLTLVEEALYIALYMLFLYYFLH